MTQKEHEQLDRDVAEKVTMIAARCSDGRLIWNPDVPCRHAFPPKYSTDIAAAFEVLGAMRKRGLAVIIEAIEPGAGWSCIVGRGERINGELAEAEAATEPLAICLACLAAAGEKEHT